MSHSPGRPTEKVEINFKRPFDALDKIKNFCSNPIVKANVISFANALLSLTGVCESKSCQTDIERDTSENVINSISEQTQHMANYEKSFLLSIIWKQMHEIDQVKLLLMFYNELSFEGQCDLFALLGKQLNCELYEATKCSDNGAAKLNLEN